MAEVENGRGAVRRGRESERESWTVEERNE